MRTHLFVNLLLIMFAITAFLCACYIYISNRTGDLVLYSWLNVDYNNTIFETIRSEAPTLPLWAKYNLPDGLWLFSYLLTIEVIWHNDKIMKIVFIAIIVCFAVILELMQFIGIFPGTGDIMDVVAYTTALFIFFIILKLKQKLL